MKKKLIYMYTMAFIYAFTTHTFVLITPLYNEKNPARRKEYITCLEKNLQHPDIEHIHVIYDQQNSSENAPMHTYLKEQNITLSYCKGHTTFGHAFEIANTLYLGKSIIIANADIYFNETLNLLNSVDLTGKCLALSRWNVQKNGSLIPHTYGSKKHHSYDSQDVWILSTPIPQIQRPQTQIGTQWCDPIIAYQLEKAGLAIYNPCKSIQACHLHKTNIRHWRRIKCPVPRSQIKYLNWCTINEII